MIAYRAETAMASIVREKLARTDDARSLLRDLFRSEADLLPDLEQGVLRVQVHPMSNPRSNRAIAHLLEHLNAAEFTYPGTNLRLVYSIAGQAETPNLAPHQNPGREKLARTDDARSLLRNLFCSEADLVPDLQQGVLRVHVHPMSNPRSNRAIAHLLEHLNAAEFPYPGTNLRLVYSIAGEPETPNLAPHQNPADQEV